MSGQKIIDREEDSVLLALLPYWTPLIPPLGITCLKSHLEKEGYSVKTYDANMYDPFRKIYHEYFEIVKRSVPKYKQGNFFNIGMEFMRNQMMAHIRQTDASMYRNLIAELFEKSYFTKIADHEIEGLIDLLTLFYEELEKYLVDVFEKTRPVVFGLSVFSGTLPASLFAFQLAKKFDPSIKTVMGGGTFSMELAIDNPNFERLLAEADYIDKFIVGEGESLFLKYLEGKLPSEKRIYDLQDLEKSEQLDINAAITPDFSDLSLKNYPQLGFWSSRSCPFQCSFCSETIHWGVYRKKKPQEIVKGMKHLFEQYDKRLFLFGDSLLNILMDGLSKELVHEKTPLYWDGYLRTDPPVCKPENALFWRKAGFYRARLGVESGSQKILDIMNKKISIDAIKQSVRSLAAAGIKTTSYWIVGHPGETEEDFQATLDLIEELKDDLWEAEVNPFFYFLTGQVNSDKWLEEFKRETLYSEQYTDMLLTQTWILQGCDPQREVIYDRVNRFVDHCYMLGIPNPYFEHEIYQADIRWKKLHPNAVPSLIDLQQGSYVDNIIQSYDDMSVDDLEDLLDTSL